METILYIEDNEVNIDIVQRMLTREGYTIHVAQTGSEGIELAGELIPDLIIVDLHLPGMNGYEITRHLKAMDSLADVKVMMLTADIYAREEGEEVGIDAYMNKPIRRKTFLSKLEEIFGKEHSL